MVETLLIVEATLIVVLLLAVAFLIGWQRYQQTQPLPTPQLVREIIHTGQPEPKAPPLKIVQLVDGESSLAVSVTHPRLRLFYKGRAWDHYATTNGVWCYKPVETDTPRQAWYRTRPSEES